MSTVYLEVAGKPVPLDKVSWYLHTPCGCCCGVTMADTGISRLTSADDAMADFYPRAEQRRRKQKAGYRVEAGLRSEVKDRLTDPDGCPHTPKWGNEVPAPPDGMAWAAPGWQPGARARLHLVPADRVRKTRTDSPLRATFGAEGLCGKFCHSWWNGPSATSGRVECARCCAAAREMAGGAA